MITFKDKQVKTLKSASVVGVALAFALGASSTYAANLVSNGDFDNDLTGWVVETVGTGVTWQNGEARIGQPGTPGVATLSQTLSSGATSFSVQFDYLWQASLNSSNNGDTFTAFFSYESGGSTFIDSFYSQTAASGFPAGTQTFSNIVTLSNIPGSGVTIGFTLEEFATGIGTRVHLDDVVVSAVPLPAAAWLFGSALLGFVGISRRKFAQA
jgi:hypothetical protein